MVGYRCFDPQSAWYIAFVVKAIVKSQMSICDISNSLKSIIPHLPSHHPQYHLQDINPLISQLLSFLACFMTNDKPLYVYYDQGVPTRMYQWLTLPAKNCYIFIGTPHMKVHSMYWLPSLVIARVTLIRGWDHTTQLKTSIISFYMVFLKPSVLRVQLYANKGQILSPALLRQFSLFLILFQILKKHTCRVYFVL